MSERYIVYNIRNSTISIRLVHINLILVSALVDDDHEEPDAFLTNKEVI